MTSNLRGLAAAGAIAMATSAAADVTLYERQDFKGRSFATEQSIEEFGSRFGPTASSVIVHRGEWEVCEWEDFKGQCAVLRPGNYSSVSEMGLRARVSSVREVVSSDRGGRSGPGRGHVAGRGEDVRITFYEREGFLGRSLSADGPVNNMDREGLDRGGMSAEVYGGRWEVCDRERLRGRCVILSPGRYASLSEMGLSSRILSLQQAARVEERHRGGSNGYRRRDDERLFEAEVVSARAIVGPAEQRCWIEREQVTQPRRDANLPGAIVGAVVGGILGHQVGKGTGKKAATAGGVVAGGVVGSQFGSGNDTVSRDIQKCETVPGSGRPEYWDVTYTFRGREHYVQMTSRPGSTVLVNERGEPRQ